MVELLALLAAALLALLSARRGPGLFLALLAASAVAGAVLYGLSGQAPRAPAAQVDVSFKLCWLRVDLHVSYHRGSGDYVVEAAAQYQAPDPCHVLTSSSVRGSGGVVYVELRGRSPEPGKACVQVLPPPQMERFTVHSDVPVKKIVFSFVDEATGERCSYVVVLPGGGGG